MVTAATEMVDEAYRGSLWQPRSLKRSPDDRSAGSQNDSSAAAQVRRQIATHGVSEGCASGTVHSSLRLWLVPEPADVREVRLPGEIFGVHAQLLPRLPSTVNKYYRQKSKQLEKCVVQAALLQR